MLRRWIAVSGLNRFVAKIPDQRLLVCELVALLIEMFVLRTKLRRNRVNESRSAQRSITTNTEGIGDDPASRMVPWYSGDRPNNLAQVSFPRCKLARTHSSYLVSHEIAK